MKDHEGFRLRASRALVKSRSRSVAAFLLTWIVSIAFLGVMPAAAQVTASSDTSLMTNAPFLLPVSDYRGDVMERTTAFGDLGGVRQDLLDKGVAFNADLTSYLQGVVDGGLRETTKAGGSVDYWLHLDTERLGLWPGGLFTVHGESKFGRSVNGDVGSLSPVNFDYILPIADEESSSYLSEYYLLQAFSERVLLLLGRIDVTGFADKNYFANNEKDQFMNPSLRNDVLFGAFVGYTTHAVVGILDVSPSEDLGIILVPFVTDADDRADDYGTVDGLFNEVSAGVEVDFTWEWAGRPGAFRPGFVWTSKEFAELDDAFLLRNLLTGQPVPTKSDNWLVNLNFAQYFWVPDEQDTHTLPMQRVQETPEGIGTFFRLGIAPADRNAFDLFVSAGLGGRGMIPGRPWDRYGVGFYLLKTSSDFDDQPGLKRILDDEWGVEIFYNFAVTPWLQITPDLQFISPAKKGADNAVVLALRVQIWF